MVVRSGRLTAGPPVSGTALVCALLLSACQTTGNQVEEPVIGQTVSTVFAVSGNQVPLPDGDWTVVGTGKVREENIVRYDLAALAKVSSNVVTQLVLVRNADPPHEPRFDPYAGCESDDYYFTAFLQNDYRGRQDCWRTQPFSLGITGSDQPHIQQFQQDAQLNGIVVPSAMIGFAYHIAEGPDAMDIIYLWNPDLILPHPDPIRTWGPEDWTITEIRSSPVKRAIFDSFREFAAEWHPKIWAGFKNQLPFAGPGS
ncbi:MAG: hypothetical protein RIC36_08125 [Rhodospirillales bacterium]